MTRTKLTNYHKQLIKEIEQRCVKFVRSACLARLRRSSRSNMMFLGHGKSSEKKAIDQLSGLMGWLASLPPEASSKWEAIPDSVYLGLITRCLHSKLFRTDIMKCAKVIARDMINDAESIEMTCIAPPVRKERTARPKSVAARRAISAEAMISEWERKMALAKTKLALYRRKQAYYKKKGLLK